MQVKKNKVIYEELFPFRKSGDMMQPDAEKCKVCKGVCCNGSVPLKPYDFEDGKEVDSIIDLVRRELVDVFICGRYIHIRTSRHDYDNRCVFKCVWGCIIPADMRPLVCKFYGPSVKYPGNWCDSLQTRHGYRGHADWNLYRKEFLKKGILNYSNVQEC